MNGCEDINVNIDMLINTNITILIGLCRALQFANYISYILFHLILPMTWDLGIIVPIL